MTHRIAMWSGPRNLSTALMRSFGSRGDTMVSDEPFYGAYLRHTGFDQPLRDAVMASMETDWHRAAAALSGEVMAPIWYQKHMAHHMVGPIDCGDLAGFTHGFLIRAPERVVASYAAKGVAVVPDDLGYARQRGGFDRLSDRLGHAPPVVDAADLLADPPGVLAMLCAALGIGFDSAMLAWPAGGRATDGVWGAHWYGRVLGSTGFEPAESDTPNLDAGAQVVSDACRPDYDFLARFRLAA
jgi:hypothetical protein